MIDTMNISANTEHSAKRLAIPSAAEVDMRDYFAAKALQGALADSQCDPHGSEGRAKIAGFCYAMADAMLSERAKES